MDPCSTTLVRLTRVVPVCGQRFVGSGLIDFVIREYTSDVSVAWRCLFCAVVRISGTHFDQVI